MIGNTFAKRIFVLLIAILLTGCIKSFHEKRLGEELWEVGYTDVSVCDKAASEEICIKDLKPNINQRGQELCGQRLQAVVGVCEKTQRKGLYAVVCQVTCKETQEPNRSIPIRIAKDNDVTFRQSADQVRVILESKEIERIFNGKGIAAVFRTNKDSYIFVNQDKETCVKGVTGIGAQGHVEVKAVEVVICPELD